MRNERQLKMLAEYFGITPKKDQYIVALAGNPNVGKSTVFNALTGLRQHTGNWPGKTVNNAQGSFNFKNKSFLLVDLPGTYSLLAHSVEEEIARDFICFGQPDLTIVVLAASSLERNLNLALQVLEITPRVVVCVNLLDEAKKNNIHVDLKALSKRLGVPAIGTVARTGQGLDELLEAVAARIEDPGTNQPRQVVYAQEVEEIVAFLIPQVQQLVGTAINPRWLALRLLDSDWTFIEKIAQYLNFQPSLAMSLEMSFDQHLEAAI
ncbi:MAG: FeoB small GTPase domain-containing protein [Bacillota bacterium]